MLNDDRLLNNLRYNFGPIIMEAFEDSSVIEIICNSDGNLWIERLGDKLRQTGTLDDSQRRLIVSFVASALETTVTVAHPFVEGELPPDSPFDGARFEGMFPPIVSSPSFAIRKKASQVFDLQDYVDKGIMPQSLVEVFHEAIKKKNNILVVGGTGSGKTTFVNALIRAISTFCPDDRLAILEDTLELQSLSPDTQFLRTSDTITMNDLLRICMRIRPDRILIGEVRDGAALALLKSWNTGHPGGVATVHADGAEEGLYRLEELIAEATEAPKNRLIARSVDLILYIERASILAGRRIKEVLRVNGYDHVKENYITQSIYQSEDLK